MFMFLYMLSFLGSLSAMAPAPTHYQQKLRRLINNAPLCATNKYDAENITEYFINSGIQIFECNTCHRLHKSLETTLNHMRIEHYNKHHVRAYNTQIMMHELMATAKLMDSNQQYYNLYQTPDGFDIYQCKHKDRLLSNKQGLYEHYLREHQEAISLATKRRVKKSGQKIPKYAKKLDQELPNIIIIPENTETEK